MTESKNLQTSSNILKNDKKKTPLRRKIKGDSFILIPPAIDKRSCERLFNEQCVLQR